MYRHSFDANDKNYCNQVMLGMARATTVSLYADFLECRNDNMCELEVRILNNALSVGLIHAAGSGEDWTSCISGVRECDKNYAYALSGKISAVKGNVGIFTSICHAFAADNTDYRCSTVDIYGELNSRPDYCHDFGWYAAMSAMGRGVAWEDSHEPCGMTVPYLEPAEFYMDDVSAIIDVHINVFYAVFGSPMPKDVHIFDTQYWEDSRRYYTQNPTQAKEVADAVIAKIRQQYA